MAKIGFFIQSSNQELFKTNTNILKDYYRKVIKDNNLDIDLYSFTCDEKSPSVYEVGDTIYTTCSDRDVYNKYYQLFKYINDCCNYEWILITNNSTLVNLPHLFYCFSSFGKNLYYCTHWFIDCYPTIDGVPGGNFKLMSLDTLKKIYKVYANCHDEAKELYESLWGTTNYTDSNNWRGVPEDWVIGCCLSKLSEIYHWVLNWDCYKTLYEYFEYKPENDIDFNKLICLTFKMPLSYDERLIKETALLKKIIKQVENNELIHIDNNDSL